MRFIPARAGNTSGIGRTIFSPPVYPRSRGEHMPTDDTDPASSGLSPLARGTLSWYA